MTKPLHSRIMGIDALRGLVMVFMLADHVREIAASILDDLLGAAALGHQIDVAVIDIVRGNPLTE